MMRFVLALGLCALVGTPAFAADKAHGKAVFDLWCWPCHRANPPNTQPTAGTGSLARKYQGKLPAALEERTDLSQAFVEAIVRSGTKSMPSSRKTEISDADLDDLAAYLAKN